MRQFTQYYKTMLNKFSIPNTYTKLYKINIYVHKLITNVNQEGIKIIIYCII